MSHALRLPSDRELTGRRLAGRVTLVSGAGSGDEFGVGGAIAFLLAAQGARVGVIDLSRERAERTVAAINEARGEATALAADVRDAAMCAAALVETKRAFGAVSALVNCAAVVRAGDVTDVSDEAWRETLDTALTGTLNLTRAASADLCKTCGAIVNISSIAATHAFGAIAYAAAKGGVEAITRDIALTLGQSGVRANALALGPLSTPLVAGLSAPARSARLERAMLPRGGDVWDAAFAALFLVSDEARWITAHTLRVDAGVTVAGRAAQQMEDK